MGSWQEFRQDRAAEHTAPAADEDFDRLCAAALGGPAGRAFTAALRAKVIDRNEDPYASDHILRVRIAEQQFVRDLERARDRGLAAPAAKPKT